MIRIVCTGPESTGKTTLSKAIADHYSTIWVKEFARSYIDELNRPYTYDDLDMIARRQTQLQKSHLISKHSGKFQIEDTDLLTIKIWGEFKYGQYPPWIDTYLLENIPGLYILCGIDTPWEEDPQREHPSFRRHLYNLYLFHLKKMKSPFIEVIGKQKHRLYSCIDVIETNFS